MFFGTSVRVSTELFENVLREQKIREPSLLDLSRDLLLQTRFLSGTAVDLFEFLATEWNQIVWYAI